MVFDIRSNEGEVRAEVWLQRYFSAEEFTRVLHVCQQMTEGCNNGEILGTVGCLCVFLWAYRDCIQ